MLKLHQFQEGAGDIPSPPGDIKTGAHERKLSILTLHTSWEVITFPFLSNFVMSNFSLMNPSFEGFLQNFLLHPQEERRREALVSRTVTRFTEQYFSLNSNFHTVYQHYFLKLKQLKGQRKRMRG